MHVVQKSVLDPDLEVRGEGWGRGGGGSGRSSRSLDKRGSVVSKKIFPPFEPQFGLKIRARAPPLDPPLKSVPLILLNLTN